MLGGHGAQVALARPPAGRRRSRPTRPTWSWAPTSRSAGRSSAATGTSRRASCRWRATATTSTPKRRCKRCDENTIGVVPVLGSTFDGSYEPIADICAALDKLQADTGLDVPVHVDGASGGFIAPFLDPDLVWDFRLPRVQSINASGHKYGLVYPGVGWVVWRNPDALPDDLVFKVNYLGGDMPTFALNFSRPGNQIVAQYYNFLRLGFEGYRRVQQASRDVARCPRRDGRRHGPVRAASPTAASCPVFAFALKPRHRQLHGVRRLGAAPRPRLAGPGVQVPREPPGSRRAARRRAQRVLARPRRPPRRRLATPHRVPREAHVSASRTPPAPSFSH